MATFNDIKINPVYETLLPPLTEDEFKGLEANILSNKDNPDRDDPLDDAIHILEDSNYIIDGHNRYKILKANGMTTNKITVHKEFKHESEIYVWIVDHQNNKRNLTTSQKMILLQKVEEQVAREAKERQREYYGNQYKSGHESNLTQVQNTDTGRTAEIMAKKMGISKNTYKDAKLVVEKGSDEQIKRMDKGGRGNGVSAIANEIREGIPDGKRKCSKCGIVKPIGEFWKREGGEPGTICKKCKNEAETKNKIRRKSIPVGTEYEKDEPSKQITSEETNGTVPDGYKRCSKCKRILPIESFYRNANGKITKNQCKYCECDTKKLEYGGIIDNSYAPTNDYYNTEKVIEWTYESVLVELNCIFDKSYKDIKDVFEQHKSDVFSSSDNVEKLLNDIQRFASSIQYLKTEIKHQKEKS